MIKKIKKRIDDYIEFDSDLLFNGDLIRIFGGAIRDSISDGDINDIDILVGSISIKHVELILEKNGYKYRDDLINKYHNSIYKDIRIINEPHTWIKGSKIIQLIRPVPTRQLPIVDYKEYHYKVDFNRILSNVDISCCGVSYDGKLYENYDNAINHCLSKHFFVNKQTLMYSVERSNQRVNKLLNRGWTQIEDIFSENRNIKIDLINSNIEIEYIKEVN